MNTAQYNHLFSFIWNIANDVLVHAFEKGEYKKIIMPMMVLRRLDILLEPTKDTVLQKKDVMDQSGIANQEPVLFAVTGYPFCNTSKFTMKKLKAEVEQIPFTYPGGIEAFYRNEVLPYEPDEVFGEPKIGYELSFTKYFYKPVQLRSLEEITSDIREIERSTEGLLGEILGR